MDDEEKRRISVFRFGVICDLVGARRLGRGERERLLREKTAHCWQIPGSGRTYISRSTILNWVRRYEASGRQLSSLEPDEREDKGSCRALDQETALALVGLRRELGAVTLPVLLKEASKRGILPADFKASRASIYRLLEREGVSKDEQPATDRRRFEAEFANDIWQSDCLHGPKVIFDGRVRKSYLFGFIDDHSRLIPHAEFAVSERLDAFLSAFEKALRRRGVPKKLYVDNGPSFRSHHLAHVTASLGIALVHARPFQPEGKGKIERWFKTVRMQFLSTVGDGLPLDELNRRLFAWIEEGYHKSVHSSTKQTPLERYLRQIADIREAPKDLADYFRKRVLRTVDKDRTVSLCGRLFEAPVELIGRQVALLFHEHDPKRVEAVWNNKSYGLLVPVDLVVNCKVRRNHNLTELVPKAPKETEQAPSHKDQHHKDYHGGSLFEKGDNEHDEL